MNADGTGKTRITSPVPQADADTYDRWPAWSPDGTKIAFSRQVYPYTRDEIYVMNADGSGLTRLTNNDTEDSVPTWSPDGTRIAFSSHRTGFDEIWVMNADASQRQLT